MACLRPCPACDRHIRLDAGDCPFCAVALPDGFDVCATTRRTVATSRAALLFLGAVAACGKETVTEKDATTEAVSAQQSDPVYSAVPPYSASPVPTPVQVDPFQPDAGAPIPSSLPRPPYSVASTRDDPPPHPPQTKTKK